MFIGKQQRTGGWTKLRESGDFLEMAENVKRLRRTLVILYLLAVVVTLPFAHFNVTFSVALGGAIALANFLYLERFLGKIFSTQVSSPLAQGATTFSFVFRFGLIAVLIHQFTLAGKINFPALLAGLSITFIAIMAWHGMTLLKQAQTAHKHG